MGQNGQIPALKKVSLFNAYTDHADFFIKARGPGGHTMMRNSGP